MGKICTAALIEVIDVKLCVVWSGKGNHGSAAKWVAEVGDGLMTEGANNGGECAPWLPRGGYLDGS